MRLIFILTVLILSLAAKPVFAVTVSLSNIPSSLSDQPFTFNVSVSGAGAGTNYLRMDLFQVNTTNYFGETYNNNSWYGDSDGKQYFPITIISGQTWNGTLQGRLGNPTIGAYPGPGPYKLKVRRYTSSGIASNGDTQTPADIQITYVLPTPTPTPSSSTTPSPSSTNNPTSSFSISSVPSEIDSSQIISVSTNLSLPSNPNTKFYLKGAFAKSGSSNYFGQTLVNASWVKNSRSYSDQFPITTDGSGNWSGNLEIQIDPFDSGYSGSDNYIFKVARYSSSGSGPTWSSEQNIKINSKEVVETDEGDETIGVINLAKISPSPTAEILAAEKQAEQSEEPYSLDKYKKVSSQSATPLQTDKLKVKSDKQINPFIIIGGLIILGAGAFSVYSIGLFGLKSKLDEVYKFFRK